MFDHDNRGSRDRRDRRCRLTRTFARRRLVSVAANTPTATATMLAAGRADRRRPR